MLRGQDPRLFPYSQLTDGTLDASVGGRSALGEGTVPLYDILDELPSNLPLSLEWPAPPNSSYTAYEWARITLEGARAFLAQYCGSRKQT